MELTVNVLKGFFFIAITATLLATLLYRLMQGSIARRNAALAAESQLKQEHAQLQTLLDTLPDLIWLKDNNGVYIHCNKRFEAFFGASEAQIRGKTDFDFVREELADFFRAHDNAALAADSPCSNEEWVTFASDGHRELLQTIKAPLRDSNGNVTGVLGIGRNITKTHELAEHFALAFRASPAGITLTTLEEGRFIRVNPRFEQLTGWSADKLQGKTSLEAELWPNPEGRGNWHAKLLTDGRAHDYQTQLRRADGRVIDVSLSAEVVEIDGTPCALAFLVDISDRKQAEAQIR